MPRLSDVCARIMIVAAVAAAPVSAAVFLFFDMKFGFITLLVLLSIMSLSSLLTFHFDGREKSK